MALLKRIKRIEDVNFGALETRFEEGLQAVIRDITDESKELTGKRTIVLKIEFTPADEENVKISSSAEVKLAKTRKNKELVYLETDEHGELIFVGNSESEQSTDPQLVLGFNDAKKAGGER